MPRRVPPARARTTPRSSARDFGEPTPESFATRAARSARRCYIAEACWHCHSQFVRPVSNEDLRFGPVSTPAEYQNADEPAAPLRHAAGRARPDPRGGQALERLAHGAPLRPAQRRAVLGDAGVSVVLRRATGGRRRARSRWSPTCSGSGAGCPRTGGAEVDDARRATASSSSCFAIAVMVIAGAGFVYKMTEFALTIVARRGRGLRRGRGRDLPDRHAADRLPHAVGRR